MWVFFTPVLTEVSDNKSLQVSRTLLIILADFNSAVVFMVSILPLISSSASPFSRVLETVSRFQWQLVSLTTSCSTTFSSSLARSRYFSMLSLSFIFTLWSAVTAKFTRYQEIFFLVSWPGFGDLFASQSPRDFHASHFLAQILVCPYTFCQHGQFLISCTILRRSPFQTSHA